MLKNRAKKKEILQQSDVTDIIDLADDKFKRGKFSEAIRHYDAALEQVPDNFRALHNKGLALFALNKFEKAIEIDSCYTMAWNNLGCFYLGLGELGSAIECFDQTLTIDTKNYDAFLLKDMACLLYTSPSPRDGLLSRMPSSA